MKFNIFSFLKIGNTDTTLTRVSAGVVAINGVKIPAIVAGANGNVMTSNGTNWTSAAPAAGG